MRKSKRYSMSAAQDKQRKEEIPMWVQFQPYILSVNSLSSFLLHFPSFFHIHWAIAQPCFIVNRFIHQMECAECDCAFPIDMCVYVNMCYSYEILLYRVIKYACIARVVVMLLFVDALIFTSSLCELANPFHQIDCNDESPFFCLISLSWDSCVITSSFILLMTFSGPLNKITH